MKLISVLALILSLGIASAQPNAINQESDDPVVEAKVRAVSETLRCVVCKNQSIADSDAGLAKDLVNLVRERIEAGETEEETQAYIVERYGEFVLLKPRFSVRNLGLWFAPMVVLALGMLAAIVFVRRRPSQLANGTEALSAEERRELEARLQGRG